MEHSLTTATWILLFVPMPLLILLSILTLKRKEE
ncbi:BH0659 [Halalkalibacterium halodurans C-125]|uniref:BH0659 protein n=1 Tax=Halalkalibacterium halodurans (strain ATCC BAA-125 / DSM 18197 / FERM 7344 / JCM 9153 / C-125) TaxID=272558 RepID=Q9KF31_HALH5|nr:BH0659 [Halalkalibacterium halodurans C-125]